MKNVKEAIQDALLTAGQRLMKTINEAKVARAKGQVERLQAKFKATHTLIGGITPMNKSYRRDAAGDFKPVRTPATFTDKDGKRHNIVLPVYHFTGWNYGKRYDGEALRAIRKKQLDKQLKNQTHYADGSPIIRSA